MAKKDPKINPTFVPVPGEVRQALLFADARTPDQSAVLAAADGTRNLATIARQCNLSREDCERILLTLLNEGELRPATDEELWKNAEKLRAAGRLEGAAQLLLLLVENGGGETVQFRLGELLELSSRRKEAAGVFNKLAVDFAKSGRLGEALAASRRAAELQPGNWQLQNALAELSVLTGRAEEAARVWRAYARRLAGGGLFEQALAIIDSAQKQLPGNDILMYAEAELLSLREKARAEHPELLADAAAPTPAPVAPEPQPAPEVLVPPQAAATVPQKTEPLPENVVPVTPEAVTPEPADERPAAPTAPSQDSAADQAEILTPEASAPAGSPAQSVEQPEGVVASSAPEATAAPGAIEGEVAASPTPATPLPHEQEQAAAPTKDAEVIERTVFAPPVEEPAHVAPVLPDAAEDQAQPNPPTAVEIAKGEEAERNCTPTAAPVQTTFFAGDPAAQITAPEAEAPEPTPADAAIKALAAAQESLDNPATASEEDHPEFPRPLSTPAATQAMRPPLFTPDEAPAASETEQDASQPAFHSAYVPSRHATGADEYAPYRPAQPRHSNWRPGLLTYLLTGLIALAVLSAGYDYQAREGMRRAAEQAAWRISASAREPLHRKLAAAAQARQELERGEPIWEFLRTPEFLQQRERVKAFTETVEKELLALRKRQSEVIDLWRKEPSERQLVALRELAEEDDITSEPVVAARELYRQWLQKQSQRPDELSSHLTMLRDRSRPAAERYAAYQTLVLEHPYAFLRDYPQGCRDLSVPVEINAYGGRNREPLPLRVLVDDRPIRAPFELPLDPQVPLTLRVPGFRPALSGRDGTQAETSAGALQDGPNGAGRLSLPRPFTRQQIYILQKVARWKAELPFVPKRLLMGENVVAAAGSGQYQLVGSEQGARLPGGKLALSTGSVASLREALATTGGWGFYLYGGRLAAFRMEANETGGGAESAGTLRWQSPDGAILTGLATGRPGGIGTDGEGAALVSVSADLNAGAGGDLFWSGRAVQALRAYDGHPLWAEESGHGAASTGAMLLLERQLVYIDTIGRLQIRPLEGAQPESLQLPPLLPLTGISGGAIIAQPLLAPVLLPAKETAATNRRNEGERLLALIPQRGRLSALLADLSGAGSVSALWKAEGEYGDWMQERNGVIWLRKGEREIEARTLTEGRVISKVEFALSCPPALLPGKLILAGRHDNRWIVRAIKENAGLCGGTLWDYELPQQPEALAVWNEGDESRIVVASGRQLYLLDD